MVIEWTDDYVKINRLVEIGCIEVTRCVAGEHKVRVQTVAGPETISHHSYGENQPCLVYPKNIMAITGEVGPGCTLTLLSGSEIVCVESPECVTARVKMIEDPHQRYLGWPVDVTPPEEPDEKE